MTGTGLIIILIVSEYVNGEAEQPVAVFMIQFILSPFAKLVPLYEGMLLPTLVPFNFH